MFQLLPEIFRRRSFEEFSARRLCLAVKRRMETDRSGFWRPLQEAIQSDNTMLAKCSLRLKPFACNYREA